MATPKSNNRQPEQPFAGFQLANAPGHLLRRCAQRSHELYNEVTAEFGLTRQQFALLLALLQQPDSNLQELADYTGTDRNTLGGIVARLETKKLIDRRRSETDRRAYQLQISAAGVALLAQMEAPIGVVGERILAPLTLEEREVFLEFARKLSGMHGV